MGYPFDHLLGPEELYNRQVMPLQLVETKLDSLACKKLMHSLVLVKSGY